MPILPLDHPEPLIVAGSPLQPVFALYGPDGSGLGRQSGTAAATMICPGGSCEGATPTQTGLHALIIWDNGSSFGLHARDRRHVRSDHSARAVADRVHGDPRAALGVGLYGFRWLLRAPHTG